MKLSIVIPAHNEEGSIVTTIAAISSVLDAHTIDYELIVVNDHSSDATDTLLRQLAQKNSRLMVVDNDHPGGYGFAVRKGLDAYTGDAVVIVMADSSDSPEDIIKYYRKLEEGCDCVFGSRFIKGSRIVDYPIHKLILNRLANWFIEVLFGIDHNDITNAFKAYRRSVIDGVRPILSNHFNLTVELPLKAIVRGFSFATVPISWTNRKTGISKLKIKEMGSRYLFIVLYTWMEKHLSRGDYVARKR
jgi:dolichol-phosphate mannosyltransferase